MTQSLQMQTVTMRNRTKHRSEVGFSVIELLVVSHADALTINQTGTRSFCRDQTGVIHYLVVANGWTCGGGTAQP